MRIPVQDSLSPRLSSSVDSSLLTLLVAIAPPSQLFTCFTDALLSDRLSDLRPHSSPSSFGCWEDLVRIVCSWVSQDLLEKLYKLLSSVYLRDSGAVIVTDSQLSCWQTFLTHVPQDNLRLELICPILLNIIANCADLKCLIDHGLLSSLFSRVQTLHTRDQHFLRWLLDLIDHVVTVRAKEGDDHGGREEAVLLLDHLVELGILFFFMESLSLISPDPNIGVVCALKTLFRFDKKYEARFKETPTMRYLSILFEIGGSKIE
jgi:hypothetical protein